MKENQCKELVKTVMYAHENYFGGHECSAVDLLVYLEREETLERRQVMYEFIHCLYVMMGEVEKSKHCPHCGSSGALLVRCPRCEKLLRLNSTDVWCHPCGDPS